MPKITVKELQEKVKELENEAELLGRKIVELETKMEMIKKII